MMPLVNDSSSPCDARDTSLTGVLPVVQMPYHEDETIDYAVLGREVDWLFEQGVDGLTVAMVSEVLRLSEAERLEVAAFLVRQAAGRGCVIVSVGAESSYQACRLAKAAQQAGVDAVMAVPPIAISAAESEIRRYYERIINAVALPVIVQDASSYVGKPMSIAMQAQLFRDFGPRIGFKPEAAPVPVRISALRDATDGAARLFDGKGGIALVDGFRRGVAGTMPGSDVVWAITALWRALQNKDAARIDRISVPLTALMSMQESLDAFLAVEKYLLVKQNVFRNAIVRGPVGYHLDDGTRAEVDRLYQLLRAAVDAAA